MAAAVASGCAKRPARRLLRVGSPPSFLLAPLYLANERGYFADAGLDLDIQLMTDTTQTMPLLAAGQFDVACAAATPGAFNAVARGARIRIVAARDIAAPGCTHEVHGNRRSFPNGFTAAAALKGKRVSVTAKTSLTAFVLDALLESAGLDSSDVALVTMRLSESAPALVAGRLDAVVDLDLGFSSPEVIPGPSLAGILPGFQLAYIFFGRTLLDGDAAPGAAFLAAYLMAVREFRAGAVPVALDRLAAANGMDPAAARAACRDRFSADGSIDAASIQRVIKWAARRGFGPADLNALQLVDSRFLDKARDAGRRS